MDSILRRQAMAVALPLAFLLAFAGCSQADLLQKIASPADQAFAQTYIDRLRHQQFEDIERDVDPSMAGEALHETLVKMAGLIPPGEPTAVTLIGAQRMNMPNWSGLNLTFEYEFSGQWLVTNVAVKRQDGKATIVGFRVIPQPASLEQQNRLTLSGKTPLHYVVLALAIVLPLLTLYALVACIRTKLTGRKWPWILFIIVGFGKLALNWTTGQWTFSPLSFQLFSASATAPLYGPWTLAISVPLGAVLFLMRRKKLRATLAN